MHDPTLRFRSAERPPCITNDSIGSICVVADRGMISKDGRRTGSLPPAVHPRRPNAKTERGSEGRPLPGSMSAPAFLWTA